MQEEVEDAKRASRPGKRKADNADDGCVPCPHLLLLISRRSLLILAAATPLPLWRRSQLDAWTPTSEQLAYEARRWFGYLAPSEPSEDGRARTPEEYLDFLQHTLGSCNEKPQQALDSCVAAFVSSFAKGLTPDQSALVKMMRYVPSHQRMRLIKPDDAASRSARSELLFLPDASLEAPCTFRWQFAPFQSGSDYSDNAGWCFFKATTLNELEALVRTAKIAEKGLVTKAYAHLHNDVRRQQHTFYAQLLPEALRDSRRTGSSEISRHATATTCFADGRALVWYVDKKADKLIKKRRENGESLRKPDGWDDWVKNRWDDLGRPFCKKLSPAERQEVEAWIRGTSGNPGAPSCMGSCPARPPLVAGSQLREVPTSWLVNLPTRFVPSPHAEGFERVHYRNWIGDDETLHPARQARYDELQALLGKWFVDLEVREYVLNSLARVLFGHHELLSTKLLFITAGRADSGKSLFMKLVQTAFGSEFVNRTDGANIRSSSGDAARTTLVQQASGRRLLWVDELQGGNLGLGVLKDVFTSGVETTARGAHSNKQGTYAPGCALWITCNPAQLPPKPEEDTLPKIALLATEDADGKRLLGSFVATAEEADAKGEGHFPVDDDLKRRIETGDFSGAFIRTLYERLRHNPKFDAFRHMPASLQRLRDEAWPAGGESGGGGIRLLDDTLLNLGTRRLTHTLSACSHSL